MTILCFQILDDLNLLYGPIYIELAESQIDKKKFEINLRQELNTLFDSMKTHECNHHFFEPHDQTTLINTIAQELIENDVCVFNRVERYYVYAFALDGRPFWAWSKQRNPETVYWKRDDLLLKDTETGNFPPDYFIDN